ncbi:MAG: sulfurtransferase [Hyphomicrobiaceae bacterium]|nr:MAG: sulfurtransferase [Hyphomicrobiaceae bacterium]
MWAPLIFATLFASGTVLFLPGAVFGLAGGALFGPFLGSIINLAGATLGATLAFFIARYLAADWVSRQAGGRLKQLVDGVDAEGWRFVAFVRLVPLFPFNLSNYALGLTRIPATHYILASLLAMAPGTFAYTWLGYAGREALAGEASAIRFGLLGLGVLAAILVLPRLIGRLRESADWIEADELKRRLDAGEPVVIVDVRGPDEFTGELGHIRAARNLPLPELERRIGELMAFQAVPLVLVCRTDRRSANAASVFRAAGFKHVAVLRQGMVRWNRRALPIERHPVAQEAGGKPT